MIVSGDRDLYTLLRDGVQVFNLDSKTLVSEADVTTQYHGVPPRLLPFFQALRGDLRAKKLRRKMFAPKDAARLTVAYETPRRLFGALETLSEADRATLAHTTLENLEQNVALHTLNDHAPTVLATGLTVEGV